MVFIRNSLLASAMALMLSSVNAHVSLTPKYAEPNQKNFTTSFHVPHGCGNYSTTAIKTTVPEGITEIVPQQLTNWVCIIHLRIPLQITNLFVP